MIDEHGGPAAPLAGADGTMAGLGAAAGLASLFSAAACCVLPLVLAAIGIGAGGLAAFVPFHWPLAAAAAAAVAAGWVLHLRKRRACAVGGSCAAAAPVRSAPPLLVAATATVALSSLWSLIEQPLLRLLGGA